MIELKAIKDSGLINQERVVFYINKSGNIGPYMLHCARARLKDGELKLTNKVYETYWFPDRDVEEGDLVVVYTKRSGSQVKVKTNATSGNRTHFFYWGIDRTVWNRDEVAAIVGRFTDWSMHSIGPIDTADDIEP